MNIIDIVVWLTLCFWTALFVFQAVMAYLIFKDKKEVESGKAKAKRLEEN